MEIWFAAGPIETDPNYVSVAAGGTGCDNPAVDGYPCDGDVGGMPYTGPQYDPNAFFRYDLGVVVLDEPLEMAEYGALPELNQLDALKTQSGKQDITFTAVGYGLQKSFPDAASWKTQADRVRMVAHPKLIQINHGYVGDFSILLSNNAHTGGTCIGDSGGPGTRTSSRASRPSARTAIVPAPAAYIASTRRTISPGSRPSGSHLRRS